MKKKLINPFNVIFGKKEFLFPYDYPLSDFPFYVDIELTNKCNLDCIMCRRQIMKRETGFMAMRHLTKIVDEVKNYDAGIRFVKQGEPILHPQFMEAIAYAKSQDVLTYVSTNFFAGSEKVEKMFKAQPDVVRISFQGTTAEEFEKFRTPAKYDVVAENVRKLSKLRDDAKSESPFLIISTSLTEETEEDKKAFSNYWLQYVDSIEFSMTTFSWLDNIDRVQEIKKQETIERSYKPCMEVATKISVNWNGDISSCCADQDGLFIIGNLDNMSLRDAWHSEKEQKLRDMVGHNLYHSQLPHCKHCFQDNYKFDALKENTKKT